MTTNLFSSRIIQSALDFDVYKVNMMSAVAALYPDVMVSYKFIVRSEEDLSEMLPVVQAEILKLQDIRFTEDEIEYMKCVAPYLKPAFVDALRHFRFNPRNDVDLHNKIMPDGTSQLRITISGLWKETILYETIIMSIVSEVRSRQRWADIPFAQFQTVLEDKVRYLKSELKRRNITNFKFSDMSTRRRFSFKAQKAMLEYLCKELPDCLTGTSNYHLARELNLTPIGTVAHEWFMGHQALVSVRDSQKIALQRWQEMFNGALGIALTDTIGIDAFLKDFDEDLSNAYFGVRHDSGCPFAWGEKMIKHYQSLNIDPMTKTLVFTDGLNFEQALNICEHFQGRVQVSFGIGTFLANDMGDYVNDKGEVYQPLSMVIKLVSCNDSPVAKISDEPEKAMCEDIFFLMNLKRRFEQPLDLDECRDLIDRLENEGQNYLIDA
ncbi:nicotinate phosphoribosyltransferase [Vibrio alginolyticus]|uniref:nicotinate phosphoribosyltransferase n=1 Tax=Vibrio sp. B1FLJ16 TaxID=2751178 RepID=UPI0015F736B0|nr:nicotinate phosphoribosyltransferase [Vibrio sp. B1FLJ16]CAD7817835.1 Catalyzes the synthesis of beta-nicotinate D-ribonucleotide from nicotinate and 5-phospho-D-ribose 1-phosphate at the expense of ATP [Vibrio sp. B1FLJ16]CAD7824229.1 Catalyzes the synthesis of beta-nicotinate D-ribonucleotide from nicotinate and 5-phospho-D-ribose 1-phosphate at the expense of ATP [Vibrio sp. B1FLJ16]CAE6932459.1 Catalyzes the synthesis of beta-nicotinate D-ribonucleotide from nicotinate and 5-phospho-D-rib